jgi:ankyrin repeat protein
VSRTTRHLALATFLAIAMTSSGCGFSGGWSDQQAGLGPADSAPLEAAASRGDLKRVHELLLAGADPNDGVYVSPLSGVVDVVPPNAEAIADLLLEAGADVDHGGMRGTNQSPLHRAAMRDAPDLVTLLLEQGADPCRQVSSPRSLEGMTALEIAREFDSAEAERELAEATSACA